MRNTLPNLIAIALIFARQLLAMAAAIMGFIGLPEQTNKIELLLEKHSGDFDVLTIMFFFGVAVLITINWYSMINFFKWLFNFPGEK